MSKTPKSRQHIIVALETLALASAVDGKLTQEKLVDLWEERLHQDTTLLGFDFRAHAQSDVEGFFHSRDPQWTGPLVGCFVDRLWIPYDDQGSKILVLKASEEHWDAYCKLQKQNHERQNSSYRAFQEKDKWLRKHWLPKYKTVGEVITNNPPTLQ